MRLLSLILISFYLIACTHATPVITWHPHERWWSSALNGGGQLNRQHDQIMISSSQSRHLYETSKYWQAKMNFQLGFYDSDEVNAFAESSHEPSMIYLTLGMIDRWAKDEAAIAYVLAHELAHLYLKHYKAKPSNQEMHANVLSLASSWLIPYAGLITGPASLAIERQIDRNIEADADELAFQWLIQSPYGLCGAQRVLHDQGRQETNFTTDWFKTHPSFKERLELLQKIAPQKLAEC